MTSSPSGAPVGWYPKRGEVYVTTLDKDRPAIVLSIEQLNKASLDCCVVGITKVKRSLFSMRVHLEAGDGGLHLECWAKCDQVTSLPQSYLQYPAIGVLSDAKFKQIEEQVKFSLGFHSLQQTTKEPATK